MAPGGRCYGESEMMDEAMRYLGSMFTIKVDSLLLIVTVMIWFTHSVIFHALRKKMLCKIIQIE